MLSSQVPSSTVPYFFKLKIWKFIVLNYSETCELKADFEPNRTQSNQFDFVTPNRTYSNILIIILFFCKCSKYASIEPNRTCYKKKQKIIKKFDKVRVRFAVTNSHLIRFDSVRIGKRLKFASFTVSNLEKFYNKVWCLHRRRPTTNIEKISILLKKIYFFKSLILSSILKISKNTVFDTLFEKWQFSTVCYCLVLFVTCDGNNSRESLYY